MFKTQLCYSCFVEASISHFFLVLISRSRHFRFVTERLYRLVLLPAAEPTLDEVLNGPIKVELDIIPDHVSWGGR